MSRQKSPVRLADEKYVALTTFKRSGDAVTTPVWVAPLPQDRGARWGRSMPTTDACT
ncbi:hypothetical protein GCM10025865_15520 [Paraoerskovia sediminicola]|uniref:PPOX class F420-dependent oxidoreductase n=1 Tax=Paraoerskovia sediminicola TaxID=1138587 RepID=A0ABM8G2K5_9CELL|nr:hypothetical protein [Paraoerskovia sediminicola]BDZ42253.1 hypothetical protein GCM10025865_15520 [Paraoerskovia sediminicola]